MHDKPQNIRLGLGRVQKVLALLGHPEEDFAAVLVAGTNGKGSVAAMLDEILSRSGIRTGLYTSPHLCHVTERVRVTQRSVPRVVWRSLLGLVQKTARGEKTLLDRI